MSSVAGVVDTLSVLRSDSHRQVFKLLFPELYEADVTVLFTCLAQVSAERLLVPHKHDPSSLKWDQDECQSYPCGYS